MSEEEFEALFRPFRAEDAPACGQLIVRGTQTHQEWEPEWVPPWSERDNAEYVLDHAERERGWIILAEREGELLGLVSYMRSLMREEEDLAGAELAYLKLLFVRPDWWGSPLAQRLMSHALEGMREKGFTTSYLWTMAGNQRARRFYERNGWQHDGMSRAHPLHGLPLVRYRREL